jgi:hypothetical protein
LEQPISVKKIATRLKSAKDLAVVFIVPSFFKSPPVYSKSITNASLSLQSLASPLRHFTQEFLPVTDLALRQKPKISTAENFFHGFCP